MPGAPRTGPPVAQAGADRDAPTPARATADGTAAASARDGDDAPARTPKAGLRNGRAPSVEDAFDEGFVHRIAPLFKLLRLYSRLEVEGIERIPDGPAILVANHTGWLGLDYAYTALSVYDARKRVVRGLAHPTWFLRPRIGDFAARLGLFEVSKDIMKTLLGRGDAVLLFPEGEKGAFKPERERYMLQEFARGYIRSALETGAPIVPVAIVGGEEANPSSARIDSYEEMLDLSLPMPQNLFPRPVKWRISFLPPVTLEGGPEKAADRAYVHDANDRIRNRLQAEVARLISVRGHPFW